MVNQFGDTEWSTNAISFRAEERVAVGVVRLCRLHGDGVDLMKVEVIGNFQVSHEGTVYRPGDTADVPDEVAKQWLDSGWVERGGADPAEGRGVEVTR